MNPCICGKVPYAIKSRIMEIEGVWVRGIWAIDRDGKRCCGQHRIAASTRKDLIENVLETWQRSVEQTLETTH